jgi:hypothetical protein
VFLSIAVGSGVAVAALAASARLEEMKPDDSATLTVVIAALLGLVGTVAEKFHALDALRPSRVARFIVQVSYGDCFRQLAGNDPPEFKAAYDALHRERTSDAAGEISGWGYTDTARRLRILRAAAHLCDRI